jgi:hypothetical protein
MILRAKSLDITPVILALWANWYSLAILFWTYYDELLTCYVSEGAWNPRLSILFARFSLFSFAYRLICSTPAHKQHVLTLFVVVTPYMFNVRYCVML